MRIVVAIVLVAAHLVCGAAPAAAHPMAPVLIELTELSDGAAQIARGLLFARRAGTVEKLTLMRVGY